MQRLLFTTAVSVLLATSASAQSDQSSANPAIKDSAPQAVTTPANGQTSFTEKQAQERIGKAGYTNVSELTKTNAGWHGTAMKDGKKVAVTLDYKGNITTR